MEDGDFVEDDPELVARMREEFTASTAKFPYVSPVGAGDLPSLPTSMRAD